MSEIKPYILNMPRWGQYRLEATVENGHVFVYRTEAMDPETGKYQATIFHWMTPEFRREAERHILAFHERSTARDLGEQREGSAV